MQIEPFVVARRQVVDVPVRGCQFHGGRKGEDGFLVVCGKPVETGYSYCSEHHRRVYQRAPNLRERRSVPDAAPEPVESVAPQFEREAA